MRKTVVVIDDDMDDLDMMKESLAQIDSTIDCISFDVPEEAIRLLGKERAVQPDCIFIDLNMPRIGGAECLKRLRNVPGLHETPIIICSTSMPVNVSDELIKHGATATFRKPYAVGEYHIILQNIISASFIPH
jgi:CheY-like chemotaxis protein